MPSMGLDRLRVPFAKPGSDRAFELEQRALNPLHHLVSCQERTLANRFTSESTKVVSFTPAGRQRKF